MHNAVSVLKHFFKQHLNIYRVITAGGFLLAAILVLVGPVQKPDPDDWAYYYAARHFADGQFTIDNPTWFKDATESGEEGNFLLQYLPIAYNEWALEKAPGYVFYLIPFQKLGLPRFGNILLALGMLWVSYGLLKRLSDEKAAMIGSLLMLFTPISLVMLNRAFMDTYASLAFLVMGGGLYFYYHLERPRIGRYKGGIVLFLALFFTGWSVVTRYTNLPIAAVLAVHYLVIRLIDWRRGQAARTGRELVPLILGLGLPVLALALYDYYIFGSPLIYGYRLTPFPVNFAFQYLGQEYARESIPAQIISYNLQGYARNLLIGFPLMLIAIPAFGIVLYQKLAVRSERDRSGPKWSNRRVEMTWDLLSVLIAWFAAVFLLYLTYEWTAGLQKGGGFVIFNRFLLPGLFPVIIITALVMARFSTRVWIPMLLILVIFGSALYAQWAGYFTVLPAWMTERTVESRWVDHVFPPWVQYPPADSGGDFFPWHIGPQGAGPYRAR